MAQVYKERIMLTLLLIIIGCIAGICFVIPTCMHIPESVNLNSKYWKKVQRHNIMKMTIGGLIGAIIFPICFMI